MPKYHVVLNTEASFYTQVEADDEETAVEEAFGRATGLCAQCSGWSKDWSMEIGDWDFDEANGSSVELTED